MRRAERDQQFKDFYFRETGRLRRIALLMVGDAERAEDLTHEALLRAYQRWGRIRNADPAPYVRRALVNLCRNDHRRRALEVRRLRDLWGTGPPATELDPARCVDDALAMANALRVLSPIRRATSVLHFYDDMSEANIAHTLDRPLNTVKSDVRRALEKLRATLDDTREEAPNAHR